MKTFLGGKRWLTILLGVAFASCFLSERSFAAATKTETTYVDCPGTHENEGMDCECPKTCTYVEEPYSGTRWLQGCDTDLSEEAQTHCSGQPVIHGHRAEGAVVTGGEKSLADDHVGAPRWLAPAVNKMAPLGPTPPSRPALPSFCEKAGDLYKCIVTKTVSSVRLFHRNYNGDNVMKSRLLQISMPDMFFVWLDARDSEPDASASVSDCLHLAAQARALNLALSIDVYYKSLPKTDGDLADVREDLLWAELAPGAEYNRTPVASLICGIR